MQTTWFAGLVAAMVLAGCDSAAGPAREDDAALSQEDVDRLIAIHQSRLPTPLPRFNMALRDHGIVDGVGFVDFELEDEAVERPPLIIAAGGSKGGFWLGGPDHFPNQWHLGRVLFAHGFSVRSIAYFGEEEFPDFMGEGVLPPTLVERPLEPIAAMIEQARATHGASRRCTGLIGVSKGGELALLLAAYDDQLSDDPGSLVDAVVAATPSHVVQQAPYVTLRIRSSWSLGGEPMDFVRYPWLSPHVFSAFFNYPFVGGLSEGALKNERAVEAASIPVERVSMPVLMQGGRFDDVWPSAQMADAALARAESRNPDHAMQVKNYDMDHFIISEAEPVLDTVVFLYEQLRAAAEAGQCEADFLPLADTAAPSP
jgi:hypothetical protein